MPVTVWPFLVIGNFAARKIFFAACIWVKCYGAFWILRLEEFILQAAKFSDSRPLLFIPLLLNASVGYSLYVACMASFLAAAANSCGVVLTGSFMNSGTL